MIKKRFKEMLFIKSKSLPFNSPISCENYNNIKYERIKKRQTFNFSFLQLSKFKPIGKKVNFFMALTKKHKEPFNSPFKVKTKVLKIQSRLNNLRRLDDTVTNEDLSVSCDLIGEPSDTAAGFNCSSDDEAKGTPIKVQLNTDDIDSIAGIPDDVEPSEFNYINDYSNTSNLKIVDALPNVTITEIDSSNCDKNGVYIIKGKYDNGILNDVSNVEIPFGYPDSSGLCDIKVNNKDVTMNCQNKEKFDYSNILFEPITVHDSEGKDIFKLYDYTNKESFSCEISVNSVFSKKNSSEDFNLLNNNPAMGRTGSSGLSGGAIVAIIISLIVVLCAVIIIIGLSKKGAFSKKKNLVVNENSTSKINF